MVTANGISSGQMAVGKITDGHKHSYKEAFGDFEETSSNRQE